MHIKLCTSYTLMKVQMNYILSLLLVTLDGFWIDWLDLLHLIHSQVGTTGSTALSLFYTLFQFTVRHALGIAICTSRILETDLSQSRCNFKSDMKSSFHSLISFLPLFCDCQFRRLNSIQFLCSQAHILAGWRLETRLSTQLNSSL
jgi:hypothetical protein